MDGLGGCPQVTFGELKTALERNNHRVVLVNVLGIQTHEGRIERVLACYEHERSERPNEPIYFAGQSAGGDAIRIAAERLASENRDACVAGVILLSPAMPRWVLFLTHVLFVTMAKRLVDLMLGRVVETTELEYEALVAPLPSHMREHIVAHRMPISGKEGRTLAFYPSKFKGYPFPTLHVYGDRDQWIAPHAQAKLGLML